MVHPIDELLQRLYQNSDEDLLREFVEVEAEIKAASGPQPDPEGLTRLWEKVAGYEKGGRW